MTTTTQTTRLPEGRRPTFSWKETLNSIVKSIVWFFDAVGEARLDKARMNAAIVLQREYPHESVGYIFNLLKNGDIGELTGKNKELL